MINLWSIFAVLFTLKHFTLFAIIEITIVCCKIPCHTAKLLNVLAATLRTPIIELALIATIQTTINREVKGQIRNIKNLERIINNVLNSLCILYKCTIQFNISNTAASRILAEWSLTFQLLLDGHLLPNRDMMRICQVFM